jgi:hypothetical protein
MADINDIGGWDETEERTSFDPLPLNTYDIEIVESDVEMKESAKGRRISVTYLVMTGPFEGRKGWDRFDIDRQSEWTDKKTGERRTAYIDKARFKELCTALGLGNFPNDSNELHSIPFRAMAKIEPASGEYGPKNVWSSYKRAAHFSAPSPTQRQAPTPQQRQSAQPAATGGGSRPGWMNRQAGAR